MKTTEPKRRRPWRWVIRVSLGILAIAVILIACVPAMLNTARARTWLLTQANVVLAPQGSLAVDRFGFSWFGPIRMEGFELRDATGKVVAASPNALLDPGLTGLIWHYPQLGTLVLDDATLDIERDARGQVDLLNALTGILTPDPKSGWSVRIPSGRLRFQTPELAAPVVSDQIVISLGRPPAPRPLSWRMTLGQGEGAGAGTLNLTGDYDLWAFRAGKPADLTSIAKLKNWPLAIVRGDLSAQARVDGDARIERGPGGWQTSGTLQLGDAQGAAGAEPGQSLALDALDARWDVGLSESQLTVRVLDLAGSFGNLSATPGQGARGLSGLTGTLDLAAMGRLLPGLLPEGDRVERGSLDLRLTLKEAAPATAALPVERVGYGRPNGAGSPPPAVALPTRYDFTMDLALPDLQYHHQEQAIEAPPLELHAAGLYDLNKQGDVTFSRLEITTPQASVVSQGEVTGIGSSGQMRFQGLIEPDWPSLRDLLARQLDSDDLVIAGDNCAFQVSGPLPGGGFTRSYLNELDIAATAQIKGAQTWGLAVGPARLDVVSRSGVLEIQPIETTLNGGRMYLEPALDLTARSTPVLILKPGTVIERAGMNEALSHRFLAYVVPLLDDATRVSGYFSARVDQAAIPLGTRQPEEPGALVEGLVVFERVEFGPGPLANGIISAIGIVGEPRLRLDQPVVLDIHDDRVYQHGLAINLGPAVQVTMEGSVGFDESLAVDVAIPLRAERFANVPVFNNIATAIKPTIPIRGTLSEPKIDAQQLGRDMGRMGLDIANEATFGGLDMILRAIGPRTPEEAAERAARQEAQRLENQRRRAERQAIEAQKQAEREAQKRP